jgi:hypothetical protein
MHIEVAAKTPLAWRFPQADRALELALVCVLVTGSLGLLAALAGVFHAPQIWMLGVLLTEVYRRKTAERDFHWSTSSSWTHMALLVLVALFFRVPAFHFVLGGQDEGVYVNIANHLLQSGGIAVSDPMSAKFLGTSALGEYLASNRQGDEIFLSGIYTQSGSITALQFQFYHLFPVWMALIGGLFGATATVYALTIFSVLSILFAYRLVLTVTGRPKVALLAGLLLAINPLHAFFSKFPVTEVPTLAFALAGFGYLAAYWTADPGQRMGRMLWLAFAALASVFFVRISGFMYIPFVLVLACLAALRDEDAPRRSAIQLWALSIVVVYAVSVLYGLHWSRQYSLDIYAISFGLAFGEHWHLWLLIAGLLGAACWALCLFAGRRPVVRGWLVSVAVNPARWAIGVAVVAALLLVALRGYWLGWTPHYAGDGWLDTQWGLSGSHWRAVKATSFAQLAVYMGPLLLATALALLCRPRREPVLEYMRLVAAGFCVYSLALQWFVPYGPYYARYLLSETLPYLIVFTLCVWPRMTGWLRTVTSAVLAISVLYGGAVTAAQVGKEENDGLYSALSAMVSRVGAHDVILLDSMDAGLPDTNEIKTPLLYTFGKNVITVSDQDLANPAYLAAIGERFDDVFLISPSAGAPRGFTERDTVRMEVWAYKWGYGPPRSLDLREDVRLHLFRRDRPQLPLGVATSFNRHGEWNDWLKGGWSDPESWGVWAAGPEASLEIDAGELPPVGEGVLLHFELRAFVSERHPRQRAEIAVSGSDVKSVEVTYPANTATFDLPVSTRSLRNEDKIVVHLTLPDAVTPKSLGISGDTRVLSFGLVSVEARPIMLSAGSMPVERKGSEKGDRHE